MNKKNEKATFVSFLLDETGSMQSIKDDTIGGFNAYVETLQKGGEDILFSLVSFNSSQTRKHYVADPIQDVAPLTEDDYEPHAMTPLIDAAVKIIKATEEAVERRADEPNVVVVMQTDGHENVSVEYTTSDLAALVKEKESAGWQFVFLGAGMDAFDAARAAGIDIDARHVVAYGRARSPQVFAATAMNVAEFAALGDEAALDYSPEQRADVGDQYAERHLRETKKREGKKRSKKRRDQKKQRRRSDKGAGRASTVEDIEL